MFGGHRDEWYPGAPGPLPPPPPPGETPSPKPSKKEDFADDDFAIFGKNLSLITRKPVFGVFNHQVKLKPACAATEAS